MFCFYFFNLALHRSEMKCELNLLLLQIGKRRCKRKYVEIAVKLHLRFVFFFHFTNLITFQFQIYNFNPIGFAKTMHAMWNERG